MDGNATRRPPRRRWPVAAALLGLATVVAIASGGSVPGGSAGVRRPSEQLLDVTLSLLVVVVLVGGVLAIVVFSLLRRDDAVATAARGGRRRGPAQWLGSLLGGLLLAIVALRLVRNDDGRRGGEGLLPGIGQAPGSGAGREGRYEPEFATWPVVITLVLAVAVIVAVALDRRARRRLEPEGPLEPAEALADVLDETLDDLRGESDPRHAVIAAYARMERALAAAGLPRHTAEAPEEYLDRVADGTELSRRAAGRLTGLFAWARFSGHDVRPAMKDEAIETLEAVRDELRAVVERRAEVEPSRLGGAAA
jgi:hypothetical protein